MNETLRAEYQAYVDLSWGLDRTALSYADWLETKVATLQSALEPFAAYGRLKLKYPDRAVFTIAYDRDAKPVILLFSDFTRAAQLLPDAQGRRTNTQATGSAGGIAEIMVGDTPVEKPKYTYRVRWISHSDGQERIGQTSADNEQDAVARFYAAGVNAVLVEVIETAPYGVPFASEGVKP